MSLCALCVLLIVACVTESCIFERECMVQYATETAVEQHWCERRDATTRTQQGRLASVFIDALPQRDGHDRTEPVRRDVRVRVEETRRDGNERLSTRCRPTRRGETRRACMSTSQHHAVSDQQRRHDAADYRAYRER